MLESLAAASRSSSTRVGQAPSIVEDGETGLLVDVDDVEALAASFMRVHDDSGLRDRSVRPGAPTAEANSYAALDPRWAELLEGFVEPCLTGRGAARLHPRGGALGAAARAHVTPEGTRLLRPRSCARAGRAVAGGTAKFQRLAERFPNHPTDFSLLYLGSTWLPRDLRPLLRFARRRRAPLVVNQDGVGYPGWAGAGTEAFNRPLHRALPPADHVLYQSDVLQASRGRVRGRAAGTWEVLHNAVDVERFTPAERPPTGGPVLLLGGDQTRRTGSSSGSRRSQLCFPRIPTRSSSSRGVSPCRSSRSSSGSGLRGRVHVARQVLAGATRRHLCGGRTSCCTRR